MNKTQVIEAINAFLKEKETHIYVGESAISAGIGIYLQDPFLNDNPYFGDIKPEFYQQLESFIRGLKPKTREIYYNNNRRILWGFTQEGIALWSDK